MEISIKLIREMLMSIEKWDGTHMFLGDNSLGIAYNDAISDLFCSKYSGYPVLFDSSYARGDFLAKLDENKDLQQFLYHLEYLRQGGLLVSMFSGLGSCVSDVTHKKDKIFDYYSLTYKGA